MEYKGLSASQFADGVEVPRAVISHILSARNKPSLEVVQKILAVHQDISISWLLMGQGDMLTALAVPVGGQKLLSEAITREKDVPDVAGLSTERDGNIQNSTSASGIVAKALALDKTIEQVMIFYSDKTFISYNPAQ